MIDRENAAPRARISLLDYLQHHGWRIVRDNGREEVAGLCPLHPDNRPSFYVNRRKQVFYCHGCGRGGGLASLMRWLEQPPPQPDSGWPGEAELLEQTYCFYQRQLSQSGEARDYLQKRGIYDRAVVERMRIGYAPGACLRGFLNRLGYSHRTLRERGLVDANGRDCFFRCLTFPLAGGPPAEGGSLYGRSIHNGVCRHRLLAGSKGGLYSPGGPRLILVEGLLDVAALWQAGFPDATTALGTQLNNAQLGQLCRSAPRPIHICFDADLNGSGQQAARRLSIQLRRAGVEALRVALPEGYDPASFFAAGAAPSDFQRCLDRATP